MIIDAVVLDSDGIPYSPERFQTEPECAQRFLEQLEDHSYKFLNDWREMVIDDVVYEAQWRLHTIQQDLISSEFLKSKGLLN